MIAIFLSYMNIVLYLILHYGDKIPTIGSIPLYISWMLLCIFAFRSEEKLRNRVEQLERRMKGGAK